MDILQLYHDFGITHLTEGHKHCRPGWVNSPCPWCIGNPGFHLGFDLHNEHYYCWRCGWHPIVPTIAKMIKVSPGETAELIKQYGIIFAKPKEQITATPTKPHQMPSGTGPLEKNHRKYLLDRGFDPDRIIRQWNVVGTGPYSTLDHLSFKHRIIIPILWDNTAASFTSRDITDKSPWKYITCPKDREVIFHKHIVYGRQDKWRGTGIAVEGPTDVWRLGYDSFATFGIEFTARQVREIARHFTRVAVMYDDDPQAIKQANKLVAELKFRGVDAFRVDIVGDPGGLSQEEANYLVKQII